uniref:Cytochrome b n=1 Tax=Macrocentrus camphoraphilus TaxID=684659 RepID=D8WHD6_9HYME|nr:cytochrome b [Macrocentrus camphoraphilus]
MNKSFMNKNLILNLINNMLINFPSPINISIWWNFGSMLGLFMIIQLFSGIFLTMHYCSNVEYSFFSIIHIMHDVNYGWLIRFIHMNGASMFFICVYIHIGRGIYYSSYKLIKVWLIGVMILLLMMMTAFMGYVLPWGQMSFWGATVITNLISAIPYLGNMMVQWIWGGFSVDNATLNRFYSFHFILPFILLMFIFIHLMFLHDKGSNNPLGIKSNFYMIKFHNYFSFKDLYGFMILIYLFIYLIIEYPNFLGDPDNFIMANSMITPIHIQPEWYFLFAYTILRSIPNKLGGVIGLLMSILILLLLPALNKNLMFQSLMFYFLNQYLYWIFLLIFLFLTLLGGKPVEYPYIFISQIFMIMYFMYFIFDFMLKMVLDNFYKNF